MKPGNIFLKAPDEREWPSYHTVCVGAFGQAILTDEDDINNPSAYSYLTGTKYSVAPETSDLLYRDTGLSYSPGKLSDATNVQGIGRTMLELMHASGDANSIGPEYCDASGVEPTLNTSNLNKLYSKTLIELLRECARFQPEKRVKLLKGHNAIRQASGRAVGWDSDNGEISRSVRQKDIVGGRRDARQPVKDSDRLTYKPDDK